MSEEHSVARDVEAYGHSLAGRPLPLVAKQAGHERATPVQQIHLDREQGLTDLGTKAIHDDENVVV